MSLVVIAISSHSPSQNYYCYNEFIASVKRTGSELHIIGTGIEYAGLGSKPKILKQFLEGSSLPFDRLIFCDAWDVLFQSDPSTIPVENKIIWNAEKACFPNPKLADKFPETKTPFRYLNSGFSIGPRDLYIQALKEMRADEIPPDHWMSGTKVEPNDQEYWQKQYLYGNVPIRLDTKAEICQTLSDVKPEELDFSGELITNKETGSTPYAFHIKPLLINHLKL
jgi:hypothetical protein